MVVESVGIFLGLRREVDAGFFVEAGEDQVEAADFVEDADGVIEAEAVEDFADVFREAIDVGFQSAGDVGIVVEEGV
jgi:hypothetical protein